MVWSSTCLAPSKVMSSSLCIAPWFLKLISAGICAAKTLCWPAVITAKQILVKKYRTMIIIIIKRRFGFISIDRISTASSFWTFCSLRSKLKSDDHNTTHAFYPLYPVYPLRAPIQPLMTDIVLTTVKYYHRRETKEVSGRVTRIPKV